MTLPSDYPFMRPTCVHCERTFGCTDDLRAHLLTCEQRALDLQKLQELAGERHLIRIITDPLRTILFGG